MAKSKLDPNAAPLPEDESRVQALESQARVTEVMKAMAARVLTPESSKSLPDDNWFRDSLPDLWAWMVTTKIAAKVGKDPAKVSFHVDGSLIYFTIMDNSLKQSMTVPARTLLEGLQALDRALLGKPELWMPWKKRRGKLERPEEKVDRKTLTWD